MPSFLLLFLIDYFLSPILLFVILAVAILFYTSSYHQSYFLHCFSFLHPFSAFLFSIFKGHIVETAANGAVGLARMIEGRNDCKTSDLLTFNILPLSFIYVFCILKDFYDLSFLLSNKLLPDHTEIYSILILNSLYSFHYDPLSIPLHFSFSIPFLCPIYFSYLGFARDDYDVVLMDLQMPVMDGIEATVRFREYER